MSSEDNNYIDIFGTSTYNERISGFNDMDDNKDISLCGKITNYFRGTLISFSWGCRDYLFDNIDNRKNRNWCRNLIKDIKFGLNKGDIILCGNGGNLSHAMLVIGNVDKDFEDVQICHSMATQTTRRFILFRFFDIILRYIGYLYNIFSNLLGSPFRVNYNTGVIREYLCDFINRFHRESFLIMRHKERAKMSDKDIHTAIDLVINLVGKQYDYDFQHSNEKYYCTEIIMEFFNKAGYPLKISCREPAERKDIPVLGNILLNRECIVTVDDLASCLDKDLEMVLITRCVLKKKTIFKEYLITNDKNLSEYKSTNKDIFKIHKTIVY